ncbi:hypothetical protein PCE1_001370 [Barthelona sp. PCE]
MQEIRNEQNEAGSTDLPFTIESWSAVAVWRYDVGYESCPVCKHPLMEPCSNCLSESENTTCMVVWGECGHAYHNHCIQRWLDNGHKTACPLCQVKWEAKRSVPVERT